MADLSETAVVLPAGAGPEVNDLYLDLLGYFGAQTGYPALRVRVVSAVDAAQFPDKDLLVLGTYGDLENVPRVTSGLPLTYAEHSFALSRRARWGLIADWLLRRDSGAWQALNGSATIWPRGIVEGTASPFGRERSVVVIAGRDRAALPDLVSALLTTMPLDGIDHTVSLWTGRNFISYPLSTPVYGSGDLPWYRGFAYWLPHHAFTLLLLLLGMLSLSAWCTQRYLAARIRVRLRLVEQNHAGTGNNEGSLHTAI
jgi:cellulose synthase (UDP-forming)